MAALRPTQAGDPESATKDRPYLLTHTADHGQYSRRLHYLLPDGRRPTTVVSVADDSPDLRHRIGMAHAAGRRRYKPTRHRRATP